MVYTIAPVLLNQSSSNSHIYPKCYYITQTKQTQQYRLHIVWDVLYKTIPTMQLYAGHDWWCLARQEGHCCRHPASMATYGDSTLLLHTTHFIVYRELISRNENICDFFHTLILRWCRNMKSLFVDKCLLVLYSQYSHFTMIFPLAVSSVNNVN